MAERQRRREDPSNIGSDNRLYHEVWAKLLRAESPRKWWWTILCVASIFLFFPAMLLWYNVQGAVAITASLVIHEAGHVIGIRLFGLRVLGVVFIPLLGALAIGELRNLASWKQAVISLLGPLPGIALAGVIFVLSGMQVPQPTWLRLMFISLLLVNLLNLIPVAPLDGWRFLSVVVSARHPLLETATLLAGLLCIAYIVYELLYMVIGLALFTRTDPTLRNQEIDRVVLNVVLPAAVFGAVSLPAPFLYRNAVRRAKLRVELADLPNRMEDMNEDQRQRLFECARTFDTTTKDAGDLVPYMKLLHLRARSDPPAWRSTAWLLALYGACWLLGVQLIRTLA